MLFYIYCYSMEAYGKEEMVSFVIVKVKKLMEPIIEKVLKLEI